MIIARRKVFSDNKENAIIAGTGVGAAAGVFGASKMTEAGERLADKYVGRGLAKGMDAKAKKALIEYVKAGNANKPSSVGKFAKVAKLARKGGMTEEKVAELAERVSKRQAHAGKVAKVSPYLGAVAAGVGTAALVSAVSKKKDK